MADLDIISIEPSASVSGGELWS